MHDEGSLRGHREGGREKEGKSRRGEGDNGGSERTRRVEGRRRRRGI